MTMKPMNENEAPRSSDEVPAVQPKKRWGIWHWLIVGVISLLGTALLIPLVGGIAPIVNHLKICSNCHEVTVALNKYAMFHGGAYPAGMTANDALRELIKEQLITDERVFSSPASPYVADNNLGSAADYNLALQKNENHWAMTKGLTKPSSTYQSAIAAPLIFENPAVSSWPPQWNVVAANKPVAGRALKVHNVVSADERKGPAFGGDMTGYSIVIGRTDGSVTNEKLGTPSGGNATVEPDASGKNIFEQAGPHEVLDVEKGPAPVAAEERQQEQPSSKKVSQREVFQSSWNAVNKITLISDSDCEIESKQGIIIASYTQEGEKMRFVFSALGSQRVGYADVYTDGIVMASEGPFRKGELLLNAEGMRMKEEADRKAEAEQQRINLEAPKVLIGLWKQVKDPPSDGEMEGVMFRADGIWASVDWQRKEATEKGHWSVKDGELNKGLFNVGTFTEGKIVELTQDRFVYERNTQKFIATRVVDGADGKKDKAGGRMAGSPTSQNQPPSNGGSGGETDAQKTIPFLNCTLTYSSHSSYWSFYLDKEPKGKGTYLSKLFEAKGGATSDGEFNYTIEHQGDTKWKITTSWDGAKDDTQEIIVWITEGDMRSGTLKAIGNVYDSKGLPMWPDGEKSMEMLFTRGKHLSGGGNKASGQQMPASEPQTKQEIRIDLLAGGDELDSACEVFTQRLVTAKDVSQWNFDQLRHAINFLYAKHGYVFAVSEVQAVFSGRPWYKANPSISMNDIDARMSRTETANVKVLAEAKSRLKAR